MVDIFTEKTLSAHQYSSRPKIISAILSFSLINVNQGENDP
jgi:hypothetical protein